MPFLLLLILLFEGFITISIEILTIRQLTPFYGNSIVITSIIIGVFLLFLALGYWRGGTYQRDVYKKLNKNLIFSMLLAGVGLSYTCIAFIFYILTIKLAIPFLLTLSLYLLLVLAPIVYCLGQTIPLTTNLFNKNLKVSQISGFALFLNTLGSFLGAILTSLLLFQYLGIAWSLVIDCMILYILIIFLKPNTNLQWLTLLGLGLFLYFIKLINVNVENLHFQKTTNYANYRVKHDTNSTLFEVNLANSAQLNKDKLALPYIEYMRNFLFKDLKYKNKNILIIGAGGFSFTAQGTNDNDVTYVDIDPKIKAIAENSFLNKKINGKFIGMDARLFLNQSNQKFDVIITDVFDNQSSIPASMLTSEYFQQLASHIQKSGLLLVNFVSSPMFADDFSKSIDKSLRSVFSYCRANPLEWDKPLTNVIYICKNDTEINQIYSDNLNTSTLDFFKSFYASLKARANY